MDIVIHNRQPRILGCSGGRYLKPGKNKLQIVGEVTSDPTKITEKELNQILKNAQFRGWQKLGWVSVKKSEPAALHAIDEPADEDQVPQEDLIRSKSVADAAPVIAACSDPELLAVWHEQDKRSSIHKMIEKRLGDLDALLADSEQADDPVDSLDEIPDEGENLEE